MRKTSLALAISALLSALPIASVQASESCTPLTGKEAGLDTSSSAARCLPGINPLQDQQWHLLNSGQNAFSSRGGVAGNDLNSGGHTVPACRVRASTWPWWMTAWPSPTRTWPTMCALARRMW